MKILLLGSNGQLGCELARQLHSVGELIAMSRAELDITNHKLVAETIKKLNPEIIVNAAAYTAVDKAEEEKELAYSINAEAVKNIAEISRSIDAWLIHYSTDYVFDGSKSSPYTETDITNPINVYGASKLSGEQAIKLSECKSLIFRVTWVIGRDGNNFAKTILRLASERESLSVINDQQGVPTSSNLITKVTTHAINAIKNNVPWQSGIYNLTPNGKTTWYEVAQVLVELAEKSGMSIKASSTEINAISTDDYPTPAQRPLNSQLDTNKISTQLSFDLPNWQDDFLSVAKDIIKEFQAA